MVRHALPVVVLGAAVLALCASAFGASAPLPPSSALVLSPADFSGGAVVATEHGGSVSGTEIYLRLFKAGARFGAKPLGAAISLSLIPPDASTAQFDFGAFVLASETKSGRQQFAREWAVDFAKGLKLGGEKLTKVEKLTVGPPTEVGSAGLLLAITIKTNAGILHLSVAIAQVDRVLAIVELLGSGHANVTSADTRAALTAIQNRLDAAFTVANSAAPTISGTPTVGQTLTADAGSWTGAPSTFTYSWSRCDGTGANCQSIAGATSSTYQVGAPDAGSTLEVNVTGTNTVGSANAASTPTALVGI